MAYELDDVEGIYEVACTVEYEEDGETDTYEFDFGGWVFVVETSKGCFLIPR